MSKNQTTLEPSTQQRNLIESESASQPKKKTCHSPGPLATTATITMTTRKASPPTVSIDWQHQRNSSKHIDVAKNETLVSASNNSQT